jgi:nonsense-mediated mRNA decay protein 3
MDQVKILCCLCGSSTTYNPSKMCINCLQTRVNLTENLEKDQTIEICRYCERYNRPPWLAAKLESSELLSICLTRIKNLSKIKVVDSGFLYTEPHSRRLLVRVKVQKEVENVTMEQECVVKFIVNDTQCDDCKKSFTPHTWTAKVQIRQKAQHMKTLHHLEQQIIEANANKDFKAVKQKDHGFDVQFVEKPAAKKFVDFVTSKVPGFVKYSKQLISIDPKSNIYNNKHTFVVDIPEVCKGDLVILISNFKLPAVGRMVLCTKVTTQIHVMDVNTFHQAEIKSSAYWKNPFNVHASSDRLKQFIVLDIEETKDGRYDVEVARADDERFGENSFKIWSHFGKGISPGDVVLGYDMSSMVNHQWDDKIVQEAPEVILVKTLKPEKKPKVRKALMIQREEVSK